MKQILKIAIIPFCCFLLHSCGNNKAKSTKETIKNVKNTNSISDFREVLKTTDPVTEAQFQNWLPTQLGAFKRVEITKSGISQSDIASAGAMYANGDTKKIELTIVDGASKDGLLAIQSHYMAQNLELNNTKAFGYEKTYEKNDLKILETYVKKDNFYSVLFLYDMRFGITLESNGLSYDEVWHAIANLDLKKLDSL